MTKPTLCLTCVLLAAFAATSSAEGPATPISPRIDLGDAAIADLRLGAGCLYAIEADGPQRLVIIGLHSLGTEDFDANGALQCADPGLRIAAVSRLAGEDEPAEGDPSSRTVGAMGYRELGSLALGVPLRRVWVVGNKAFVAASPAAAGGDPGSASLFEVDVSDRGNPKLIKSVRLPVPEVLGLAADTRHLALCGSDQVLVYQVSNLDEPKSRLEGLKGASGLALSGNGLFVACKEGLLAYGLKDGVASRVGQYDCGPVTDVFLESSRKSVTAYLSHSKRGQGVEIVDLSKPDAPQRIGIAGGRTKGAARLDSPTGIGVFSTSAKGYSAKQICVGERGFGLKVFDITRPQGIRYVGSHPGPGKRGKEDVFPVCVDGSHAYVGGRGGIEIVLLGAGIHLDFAHEFVADMARDGDYLYVVESEGTKQLYIFRLRDSFSGSTGAAFTPPLCIGTYRVETPEDTDLEQPGERIVGMKVCSLVGNIVLGAPLRRIRVVDDRALIVSSPAYQLAPDATPDPTDQDETQPPRLFVVDVSQKNEPRVTGSVGIPLRAVDDLAADTAHVAVSGEDTVLVYLASDLEEAKSEIELSGASGLELSSGRLFVGCSEGLKIYGLEAGVADLLGEYACKPVGSLFVSGNRAYLCHPKKGGALEIVDVSRPSSVKKLGEIGRDPESVYHGIECPMDVEVRGDLACVMDYCFGLKVFDISKLSRPRYLGGHYKFSRWWKVVSFRSCTDETHAYVGLRAALEIVKLPVMK